MKPSVADIKEAGGYELLYVDPPWEHRNGGRGAAINHYETTETLVLKDLPVPDIAAPDAVMFMWVTRAMVADALALAAAWDFRFMTIAFTWIKRNPSGKLPIGGGFWTRSNPEYVYLFVRGKPPRRVDKAVREIVEELPRDLTQRAAAEYPPCSNCEHSLEQHTYKGGVGPCLAAAEAENNSGHCDCSCYSEPPQLLDVGSVLDAPRGVHSAKPVKVRARIDELMGPDLPRVELFARERAPGWDAWGDGVPGGSDFEMGGI